MKKYLLKTCFTIFYNCYRDFFFPFFFFLDSNVCWIIDNCIRYISAITRCVRFVIVNLKKRKKFRKNFSELNSLKSKSRGFRRGEMIKILRIKNN